METKKIFIVDDEEMYAEMLKDYLQKNPIYQIEVFHTGEECLSKLNEQPDVIVLDYYLNSVSKDAADGMQILETIKKQDKKIHVIMLSSQESYAVALKTITKGAEHYVIKGVDSFPQIDEIIREIK